MTKLTQLSRREREIMQIVFAHRQATVHEICARLDGKPTPMAVRRLLAILMEKGHLRREKRGREFVYQPRQSKKRAGARALRQVIETFFDGSVGTALATHLESPGGELSDEEVARLDALIEQLKQEQSDEK